MSDKSRSVVGRPGLVSGPILRRSALAHHINQFPLGKPRPEERRAAGALIEFAGGEVKGADLPKSFCESLRHATNNACKCDPCRKENEFMKPLSSHILSLHESRDQRSRKALEGWRELCEQPMGMSAKSPQLSTANQSRHVPRARLWRDLTDKMPCTNMIDFA